MMKNMGRTIRVGITVGAIFFGWYLHEFYARNWDFQLFSRKHWSFVWNEFKSGWVISATSDWIFALAVLLMIPIFILLWWLSCKISWRKSIKLVFRKIKGIFISPSPQKIIRKKVKLKAKGSHKKVRPLPMASVGRPPVKMTGRTMDAKMEETPQAAATKQSTVQSVTQELVSGVPTPAAEPGEFLTEEMKNIPLDDIQLPERVRLEENLVEVLMAGNYQVIQDVQLASLDLAYVGISADKVVLCLSDKEKGDWLADEEFFNEEEPLWFSETSHRVSPVYRLLTVTKEFAKRVKNHNLSQEIVPILIEKEGTIINAPDMMEVWKKMGVVVCRTDLGGPEELSSFADALPSAEDKGTAEDLEMIQKLF